MRLKQIKLAGFKSFVDPTTVPFPDAMTAIVGPNGCGKSNIIDAVRWVLGESSAKNLRGDAMTDVIFNGSSARKPVSQASVELVFDNTQGRLQGSMANYNELSIKRVVTREAQSTYFLNGTKCRRRDITDIFLGTGLGPRSYAIIEQGMISRLIESRPQELRVFIEEAAGISKYKERRRETENRMRHTVENLERLEDVRLELGQQLEKLRRQSAAARRFKELKAKERTYKAELCVIRWLKMTHELERLEKETLEKQKDLDAFVADQRGGELNIVKYKEQQQDLKAKLEDIQQQYFSTSNAITRLEQQVHFGKQRKEKAEIEIQQLQNTYDDARIMCEEEAEKLETLKEEIDSRTPQFEMLQMKVEEGEAQLEIADNDFQAFEQTWSDVQRQHTQLQQQEQLLRTRIQSLHELSIKTKRRIEELEAEAGEAVDSEMEQLIESLGDTRALVEQQLEQAKSLENNALVQVEELQQQWLKVNQEYSDQNNEHQVFKAKLETLLSLQDLQHSDKKLSEEQLQQHGVTVNGLQWSNMKVDPKWQTAVEFLLGPLVNAHVINQLPDGVFWAQDTQVSLIGLKDNPVSHNSIASQISGSFPTFLNNILMASSINNALEQRLKLEPGQSFITPCATWIGDNWILSAADNSDDGVIHRALQIDELNQKICEAEEVLEELTSQQNECEDLKNAAIEDLEDAKAEVAEYQRKITECDHQLQLRQQEQRLLHHRAQKIETELARQRDFVEEEAEQMETLQLELETVQESAYEAEEKQESISQERESKRQLLESARANVSALQQQLHHEELHLQNTNTQYQGVMTSLARAEQQLVSIQHRQQELRAELEEAGSPLDSGDEELQQLLEQRAEIEIARQQISDELADVDSVLSDAEKGQQGILGRIDGMRSELESSRLETESFRIRSRTAIEQLNDIGMQLKDVLETLDPEADETLWTETLEKTTASISRLGPINLAAIEEFDIQSERKDYLDAQHQDLTSALETLEDAIRKIDRETRAKFKETFEQVNSDLMTLFPKVFGGGNAYLDLTDDDLLETGVTIMARPPGKKNSTIHLLSGGEKALTALSLVFAIFRLNPAPFCMLDEVDAPLDDANVGRFCRLVKEMSNTVQFIYISHNKVAMEMASHLTGVTMGEPGVSRMVAVDVDEAVAMVEA